MQYTLRIFERMHGTLPPLVPETLVRSFRDAISRVKKTGAGADEAEEYVMPAVKALWPYRRAFSDILSMYEDRLGHRFVRAQLSPPVALRYREFEAHGGAFRDVLAGPPKPFFSDDDYEALRDAIMRAWRELNQHAAQAALSVEKDKYLRLIEHYGDALREMERTVAALHAFADRETEERPALAEEIRSFVCGVNHGLCALGPAPTLHDVQRAHEHFLGRKQEKKVSFI